MPRSPPEVADRAWQLPKDFRGNFLWVAVKRVDLGIQHQTWTPPTRRNSVRNWAKPTAARLTNFFTCVRELEVRIEQAAKEDEQKRPDFEAPRGIPRDFQEHVRLMYDLMVVAFRTDSMRIATFMVGNAGSNRAYRMVEVNSGWHSISHHRNEDGKVRDLQKIDQYLVEQFGYFLEKLRSVNEGDRTLLDNSMIVYGSGLGDGNRHNHADLPVVLAGRGGGTIKTGRHIKMSDETPLNNLLVSMIDRVGAKVDSFGDSTGRHNFAEDQTPSGSSVASSSL